MQYREIIAVSSEIHTKRTNPLCEQKVQVMHAKPGGRYSNRWAIQHLTSYASLSWKVVNVAVRSVRRTATVKCTRRGGILNSPGR